MTLNIDRRTLLATGAAFAAAPGLAQAQSAVLTKPIPHSGEQLPVVGIGTSQVFNFAATDTAAMAERRQVIERLLAAGGGRVIDTAPSYGQAEARVGDLLEATGLRSRAFIATKVAAGRADPNGAANRERQKGELAQSQARMKSQKFELIQLHNVGDATTDLALLKEWKAAGTIRYHGMTTTSDGAYEPFEQVMRREKPDFIEVDYAIDNRNVEQRILPLAQEIGAAVLVALPFGRNRLFSRVAGVAIPDFAKEMGCDTWAKFFLKFLISHPAVTCVIPGTDKPEYMTDNLGAGRGIMPDAAMRQRMIAFIEALPAPAAQPGGRRGG